jgi:hypothetical protein
MHIIEIEFHGFLTVSSVIKRLSRHDVSESSITHATRQALDADDIDLLKDLTERRFTFAGVLLTPLYRKRISPYQLSDTKASNPCIQLIYNLPVR